MQGPEAAFPDKQDNPFVSTLGKIIVCYEKIHFFTVLWYII